MILLVLSLRGLPQPDTDITLDIREDAVRLLSERRFVLLLAIGILLVGTTSAAGSFFSINMRVIGAGDSMTGAAWLVRTLAEAVISVGVTRISADSRKRLPASTVAYIVAFPGYRLTGWLRVIFAMQLIHGVAIGLFGFSSWRSSMNSLQTRWHQLYRPSSPPSD